MKPLPCSATLRDFCTAAEPSRPSTPSTKPDYDNGDEDAEVARRIANLLSFEGATTAYRHCGGCPKVEQSSGIQPAGWRQKSTRSETLQFKSNIPDVFGLPRFFHKNKSAKAKKSATKLKHSTSEYGNMISARESTAGFPTFSHLNNIDEGSAGFPNSHDLHENQNGREDKLYPVPIPSSSSYNSSHRPQSSDAVSARRIRQQPQNCNSSDGSMSFTAWLQVFLSKRRPRHSGYGSQMRRSMTAAHPISMMRNSASLSVVHEAKALGSDGESVEVSPCTSDQMSASLYYQNAYGGPGGGESQRCYVPNVKMRQKPPNRRWSEQDIQKRLSLPADIKLPQTVVEKLNRTPTLDNPLTRKSRRASLSEIGFGKLETYKRLLDLGEGTYATVYLGKSLLTGKSVALKEIRLNHEEGAPCTAIREVSLLRNLRHANVVTLHDVIYTDRILTLVFEFVEHDLREYMEEVDGFVCMNNVKLFMIQLLRGLAYCHKRRILHRDLKPQNLLINRVGELKLADFGLARAQSVPTKTYSNEVVTLWYRPPDVLLGSIDYSTHIDMWGIGCIFYELLANRPLFSGSTTDEQLNLIFQRFGTPTVETDSTLCRLPLFKLFNFRKYPYPLNFHLSMYNPPRIGADCTELLQKFLKYDGRLRVSALEAMNAAFFADLPQAEILRLPDTESVLILPGVSYVPELNNRRSIATS